MAVEGFQNSDLTYAHVAWQDYNYGAVGYVSVLPNGVVGTPEFYADGAFSPSIAVSCNTVHIVWSKLGMIQHWMGARDWEDPDWNVVFSPPVETGLEGDSPNLAVDGLGNLHMLAQAGDGIGYARWSRLTQLWSAPETVNDPGGGNDPSIAVDPEGDLHAVWTDYRMPSASHVYYDRGACMVHAAQPETPPFALATLPPSLQAARIAAGPDDRLPVILRLREKTDLRNLEPQLAGLPVHERRRTVISALKETAARTQTDLLAELERAEAAREAEQVHPLWIVNAVAAHVSPTLLDRLAGRPEVQTILDDRPRQMIEAGSREGGAGQPPPTLPLPPPPPPPDIAWGVSWIGAPLVWEEGYRGQCILVAVLDTGIDYDHPDLTGQMWVNPGEIPDNGHDDDGNGYDDDVHGYDFGNDDSRPFDWEGHGTHVAGTIAGDGTSGTITGVAPEARLMAVKVLDDAGYGNLDDVARGVQYAMDNGAQVMNLSLGWWCPTPEEREMFREKADATGLAGITMCVSSGNNQCSDRPPHEVGSPGDIPPPWISPDQPDLGAESGVTTVGANGYQVEEIADFSSRGPTDWSQTSYGDWRLCDEAVPHVGLIKPDVTAPGEDILSTRPTWDGGGYVLGSGTSMASPHVAGLAALMLSKNHELLCQDIHRILETSAIDLGDLGKDNTYGAGRVSAPNAVDGVPAQAWAAMSLLSHVNHDTIGAANRDGRLNPGETVDVVLEIRNNGPWDLAGVVGTLTADSNIVVLDAVASFGDMVVDEVAANTADPYQIRVPEEAEDGTVVNFLLHISAYGTCLTLAFPDTIHAEPCIHLADHAAGGVRFSVTDQGIEGFIDGTQSQGAGFIFPKTGGANRLWIGSLWAGTDSTYALNRDYEDDPVKDWDPLDCLTFRPGLPGDPMIADEIGIGRYDDAGNPSPRGLTVVQRSYAWASPPNDDYVIMTYDVVNGGAQQIHNLWLGMFMDWDLDAAGGYAANEGGVDASRDLVYMWRPTGGDGAYVGVRSLSHVHPLQMSLIHNPTYVWPDAYLHDRDRYRFLSGAPGYRVTDTPAADDWSSVIGIAPFTLDAGDTVRVAFAVLAGTSLADLQANADAAAARWAANWGAATDVPVPGESGLLVALDLGPPTPNPFQDRTAFTFTVDGTGSVQLDVYDVSGRRLKTLFDGVAAPGSHIATWNGRDDAGRSLSSGLYYVRLRNGKGEMTQKMLIAR